MNKHNLEAIDEIFAAAGNVGPINENFYWAVRGNWPTISQILAKHFDGSHVQSSGVSVTVPIETAQHLYYMSLEIGGKCHVCGQFRKLVEAVDPSLTGLTTKERRDEVS